VTEIVLPAYGWKPRDYQMPAWQAMERGCKRFALAWHRRAGKDDFCLHTAAVQAMQRVGSYWHMLPEASQARKAIWDAVDPHKGIRRIALAFPPEIRETTREQEMFIRFKNGSTWQVVGSDNFNSLVGSPPVGVVFSEYALADPAAWAYLRPILAENGGFAAFISTPRGRNHFSKMIDYAMAHPDEWCAQVLGYEKTKAIAEDVIDREYRELAAERGDVEAKSIIDQEYRCSFDAALPGAYYGELMARAEREGRIADLPWWPDQPVGTAWDLGFDDSTAIWFYQQKAGRTRIINYYEASNVGWGHYANKLKELPYAYGEHYLPHDGGHDGKNEHGDSISTMLKKLGIRNRVLPRDDDLGVAINHTRGFLATCEFTANPVAFPGEDVETARLRMTRGLDTLRLYHREWSDKLRKYNDKPKHDWTSHGADAFRALARAAQRSLISPDKPNKPRQSYAITD